jgi:hypothetical protein
MDIYGQRQYEGLARGTRSAFRSNPRHILKIKHPFMLAKCSDTSSGAQIKKNHIHVARDRGSGGDT